MKILALCFIITCASIVLQLQNGQKENTIGVPGCVYQHKETGECFIMTESKNLVSLRDGEIKKYNQIGYRKLGPLDQWSVKDYESEP